MTSRFRFPIRLKILVALLLAVTGVTSVIVFSMGNLFHEDKKTYITDLASMTSLSVAEESRSLLTGYRERITVYARILLDPNLAEEHREKLLHELFGEFPLLVSMSVYRQAVEVAGVDNAAELERAGITRENLRDRIRSNPLLAPATRGSEARIRNETFGKGLPSLLMAFEIPDPDGGPKETVAAFVRLDELLRLASRTRVFEVFLADSQGVLLAHPDATKVSAGARADLGPQDLRLDRRLGAGRTVEYERDGTEYVGGFSDVGVGGVTAGARIPRSAAFVASQDLLSRLGQVALLLLICAALLGIVWAHRFTRPLERLSAATGEIAKGRFDIAVKVSSRDEIGDLAMSFNQMASGLREREEALQTAQAQLVQSEKMAAFGQLGAGIAHEVKNPLAGILGCAQLALRKAEPGSSVHANLGLIEKETKRCRSIIDNLMKFARQQKVQMDPIGINAVVGDAVAIVHHQLEMNRVHLETDLDPALPEILGDANQLQQVLMNLMINAQQAMEGEPGRVSVASHGSPAGGVEIRVQDTGPGIRKEILAKIFEPFFTTKPAGKGTGLGLSVSFGIVKDHGGEIRAESELGQGSTFIITLPPRPERPVAAIAGETAGGRGEAGEAGQTGEPGRTAEAGEEAEAGQSAGTPIPA